MVSVQGDVVLTYRRNNVSTTASLPQPRLLPHDVVHGLEV